MKPLVEKLVVCTMLFLFVVILVFIIYLNSISADLIEFSFSKTKQIDLKNIDAEPIVVNLYLETQLNHIPHIVQKIYLGIEDNRFYQFRPSIKKTIRGVISSASIDFRRFFSKRYSDCYNPDILTKIAHNALVVRCRKIPLLSEEAYLAAKISRKYGKEVLLEKYLNQLYFGNGIFGIEAASHYYFGKNLTGLQLHQIVLLSAISIGYYDSEMDSNIKRFLKVELLIKRRNKFLDSLVGIGIISTKQAEDSKRQPLDIIINLESQE